MPSDLADYHIYASYLQFSAFDVPLRIEFLGRQETGDLGARLSLISRLLRPLSTWDAQCALPVPQIEAHLRAVLPAQELDFIVSQLARGFQRRQLQEWQILQMLHPSPSVEISVSSALSNLSADDRSASDKIPSEIPADLAPDLKSFYGVFLGKRHDRMPFA